MPAFALRRNTMVQKSKRKDNSALEGRLMKKPLKRWAPLFLLPTVIAFAIGFVWPFVWGIYLSFFNFRTLTFKKFVGIENYIDAFSDPSFTRSFAFTSVYTVVSVIAVNVLAFLIAFALTKKSRGSTLFRTVFCMPNLIG